MPNHVHLVLIQDEEEGLRAAPDGAQGFDKTQQLFSSFGGVGFSFTLFIDRSGEIRQVYSGELSRGFLHNQIEEILSPES